jgi:hypothetical protein
MVKRHDELEVDGKLQDGKLQECKDRMGGKKGLGKKRKRKRGGRKKSRYLLPSEMAPDHHLLLWTMTF